MSKPGKLSAAVSKGDSHHLPATPEHKLEELRKAQRRDRAERPRPTERIKARANRIASLASRVALIHRLSKAGVVRPWLVLTEADKAARAAGIDLKEFRAVTLGILQQETGLPQRAVFGCDHGAGARPPYCGDAVTPSRGAAFYAAVHGDPYRYMNGVHWTQTTWYEKIERVHTASADLTSPKAHLAVCLGDLAVLVKAYGEFQAIRAYNGSGPAADAYAAQVWGRLPAFRELLD